MNSGDKTELEQDLVRRAVAGDRGAWSVLAATHRPAVWGFLRGRFGLTPPDADDVTQNVFLSAQRKLPSFQSGSRLYTWLIAIALCRASDHWREKARRGARQASLGPSEREQADGQLTTPEDLLVEAQEQREELRVAALIDEALRKALDSDERAVAEVMFLGGRGRASAAEVLGEPEGTIRGREVRARNKLRNYLLKAGVTGSTALAVLGLSHPRAHAADKALAARFGAIAAAAASLAIVVIAVLVAMGWRTCGVTRDDQGPAAIAVARPGAELPNAARPVRAGRLQAHAAGGAVPAPAASRPPDSRDGLAAWRSHLDGRQLRLLGGGFAGAPLAMTMVSGLPTPPALHVADDGRLEFGRCRGSAGGRNFVLDCQHGGSRFLLVGALGPDGMSAVANAYELIDPQVRAVGGAFEDLLSYTAENGLAYTPWTGVLLVSPDCPPPEGTVATQPAVWWSDIDVFAIASALCGPALCGSSRFARLEVRVAAEVASVVAGEPSSVAAMIFRYGSPWIGWRAVSACQGLECSFGAVTVESRSELPRRYVARASADGAPALQQGDGAAVSAVAADIGPCALEAPVRLE